MQLDDRNLDIIFRKAHTHNPRKSHTGAITNGHCAACVSSDAMRYAYCTLRETLGAAPSVVLRVEIPSYCRHA